MPKQFLMGKVEKVPLSTEVYKHIRHNKKSQRCSFEWPQFLNWMHITFIAISISLNYVQVNFLFIHLYPDWILSLPDAVLIFFCIYIFYENSCPKDCLSYIMMYKCSESLVQHQVIETYELSKHLCVSHRI